MAINITFMIGNGFDRQLGLETSYTSFYKWNSDKENNPEYNDRNMIYKSIVEDVEKWSDFESALGEFTKSELKESGSKEDFFIDLDEVINDLINYLQQEEKQLNLNNGKLNETVRDTLNNFHKELAPKEVNRIESTLSKYDSANFETICFNYTGAVEKFFQSAMSTSYKFYGKNQYSKINKPLYVHGKHNYHVIVGVDNNTQLNEELFTKDEIAELTKFSMIEDARDTRLDDATRIIENSNILVIFGMALGETDASWWKLVGDWLVEDENRYLIIHSFEENYSTRLTRQVKRVRKKVEDKFLKFVEGEDEVESRLREQIFVIVNSKNTFMIKE